MSPLSPSSTARALAPCAWLQLSAPLAGSFRLEPDVPVVLGRSLQATVPVPDSCVSRRHCKFTLTPKGVVLSDLDSANGTYLNGRRIRQALVAHGDLLELGETQVRLELEGIEPPRASGCVRCGEPLATDMGEGPSCPRCREREQGHGLPGLETVRRLAAEGFLVLECRSRSGLVAVYTARKVRLEQVVALKVLALDGPVTQVQLRRFLEGAQAHAPLRHRHVVAIHDVRQTPHLAYVVMELVDGETLAERLAREGALPLREALRIAYELGQALEHLRERRVVHRDVKPANLMLTPEGDVKLIDFGLARLLGPGDRRPDARGLGTPGYMAPEQRTERLVDCRADLFGLGATLYHMLAGAPPPTDGSALAAVRGLDLPAPVRRLLRRLLEPDRDARLPSPAAALEAIEQAVRTLTGVATPGAVELLLRLDEGNGLLPTPPVAAPRPPDDGAAAFEGTIEGVALLEVLQHLELHRKDGRLEVEGPAPGPAGGTLTVRGGVVIDARVGERRGRDALQALLALPAGRFRFVQLEPAQLAPATCRLQLSAELLVWLRAIDEG